ncbi:nucleoside-diphosphate sugar epimerase/dehydratase [Sporosarcina sp. OR05]|uniref:nucleoside-diphosphate sugar epimerase/dehydratase n=1 Tax=Sporosarcina sp. OR05 TaxID=2969819 RepID=UPI00352A4BBC
MIVRQIFRNPECGMSPALFVDDDRKKQDLEIFGVKVLGGTKHIPAIAEDNDIEKIIITIPSMDRQEQEEFSEALCG